VAKLDRLTRSVKDLCELLERFERRGVASPAMTAGVTDRLWEIADIVRLMDDREARLRADAEENPLARFGDALGHNL
jgi:DNA invertase Pin-like site-specific DNA recombinase